MKLHQPLYSVMWETGGWGIGGVGRESLLWKNVLSFFPLSTIVFVKSLIMGGEQNMKAMQKALNQKVTTQVSKFL